VSEAARAGGDDAALRAEHDELAARVATRGSIDDVRRGAYAAFAFLISSGLTVKFAWDRWGTGPRPLKPIGRYPILFVVALAIAVVLGWVAATSFAAARRKMRVEDRDFARLRELRSRLGIDA
jgi:hypothetical protein